MSDSVFLPSRRNVKVSVVSDKKGRRRDPSVLPAVLAQRAVREAKMLTATAVRLEPTR